MRTTNHPKRTRAVLASLLVAGISLAACGDDDDTETADTTTAETTDAPGTSAAPDTTSAPEPTAPDTTSPPDTTAADAGQTIDVVLSDYAFGGLPASVPAGTKLQVQNTSKKEMHELVAFRIPDSEKRSVDELAALPPQETEAIFGNVEPATVLVAPPGAEQIEALGDGTLSEPGRYAVVCFIPTGADPQEFMTAMQEATDGPPEVDGGPPHIMKGMHAELVVE